MELVVTQLLNGCFLGGPKNMSFTTSLNNSDYHITIDQLGKRVITITSLSEKYKDYLSIYYLLTSLLMLFDGVFYPVISAFDGTDITASWEHRELRCYHSADFILTYGTKLIDFENVLSDTIFQKWNALRIELDIIHNMVLYCLSSVEIPKDIQCAFMIEAFEGLIELICAKDSNFIMPSVQKGESKLKLYLLAVMEKYDPFIFSEELSRNKDGFVQTLVNSRNRIAHIKTKDDRQFLDGGESVMYLVKLSFLYRVVLLNLLGVPENQYIESLKSGVQIINDNNIIKAFLSNL